MTKQEYEELRSTIESVGEYYNSIEELTKVRDIVEEVDTSNNLAMLDSPVKLTVKVCGEKNARPKHQQVSRCRNNPLHQNCHPPKTQWPHRILQKRDRKH